MEHAEPSFGRGLGHFESDGTSQCHVAAAAASRGTGPPAPGVHEQIPSGYRQSSGYDSEQLFPCGTDAYVDGHVGGFFPPHPGAGVDRVHCPVSSQVATTLHARFELEPYSHSYAGMIPLAGGHFVPAVGGLGGHGLPPPASLEASLPPPSFPLPPSMGLTVEPPHAAKVKAKRRGPKERMVARTAIRWPKPRRPSNRRDFEDIFAPRAVSYPVPGCATPGSGRQMAR